MAEHVNIMALSDNRHWCIIEVMNKADSLAQKYIRAQDGVYDMALSELRAGKKRTHWMWFIFPQITGLGRSSMARRYAIAGVDEAKEYLAHPILGKRLVECTEILLTHEGLTAHDILGEIDELKLRSSMTLFASVTGPGSVFQQALDKYFDGEPDRRTLEITLRP